MYLQKNKKGFTLIELMVVVAIIGILALLGLRLYTGQQQKAKNSIVKANAGTVQTLIQANLADQSYSTAALAVAGLGEHGMRNPYVDGGDVVLSVDTAYGGSGDITSSGSKGVVYVAKHSTDQKFYVQGCGESGSAASFDGMDVLTAQR